MIRINLLPEELRSPDAPPAGRLATISASLIVLGFAFSTWLVLVFVRMPQAREERKDLRQALATARHALPEVAEREEEVRELGVQLTQVRDLLRQSQPWSARLESLGQSVGNRPVWVDRWHAVSVRTEDDRYHWQVRVDFGIADADEARAVSLHRALAADGRYRTPWATIDGAALHPYTRDFSTGDARFRETQHYRYAIDHRTPSRAIPGHEAPAPATSDDEEDQD